MLRMTKKLKTSNFKFMQKIVEKRVKIVKETEIKATVKKLKKPPDFCCSWFLEGIVFGAEECGANELEVI